jgi:hypothetical protein
MNIVKLQNMLRGVGDDALINYVQNPTGEVPSYLALSELKRRKEVRDTYQAAKPEEKSVAEDLTQSPNQGGLAMLAKNPTPQGAPTSQGVADLPVDEGMYQEQNFVGGGIVAFADGGETAEEDYYDRFKADVGGISNRAGYKHKFINPDRYKYKPVKRFAGPDGSYVIPSKTPREYWQAIQGNKDLRKPFWYNQFETPYDEAIKYYSGLKQSATDPESQRQLDNAVQELQMQKYRFARSKEDPTEKMMRTGMTDVDTSGKKIRPPLTIKDLENKISGNNTPPNPVKQVIEGATGKKEDEIVMAPEVDVKEDMFAFDKRPENVADIERKRYKEIYGDDPFIKRGQTRLEAMDKRAKTLEDQNLGMALMAAGFKGMQGTSPFALVNLGAGAEAGLKQYADTQKQLVDLDEKRFNVDAKIAEAQRAVENAAITQGFRSEDYNKASNDLLRNEIYKGRLDMEKYKILAGTNETKMIMAQKQNFQRDLNKYLEKNYGVKTSLEIYSDKKKFDALPEDKKRAILQDVELYNRKLLEISSSYPLANMGPSPIRDPFTVLRNLPG